MMSDDFGSSPELPALPALSPELPAGPSSIFN
jgi:hypothetical protein